MLALGLVQRHLRLDRRLLAPFAISFPSGLLAPAFSLTMLLLLLEFGSGLSGVPLADLRERLLRRDEQTALDALVAETFPVTFPLPKDPPSASSTMERAS
jgi:hypothetical protein